MNKNQPTKELPKNMAELGSLNLSENRGLAMILNLLGIGLLFGVGWLLTRSLVFLRPAYLSSKNILIITGMREFWRGVLLLAVSLGLMILLNEGIHAALLWIITGERPRLGFRGFYTYAAAPGWYIPRNLMIMIKLAPLVLITVGGIALVPFVPLNLVPGVLLLISLNIASAVGDVATAWWLFQKPADVLVLDDGDGVRVFRKSSQDQPEGNQN